MYDDYHTYLPINREICMTQSYIYKLDVAKGAKQLCPTGAPFAQLDA